MVLNTLVQMTSERSIVIGCDQAGVLTSVLQVLKQTSLFAYQVVTAARISDLISIVKSLDPDLVILCFRNNQLVLNDFDVFVKKPQLPVLCMSGGDDHLQWNKNNIVFTYALRHLEEEEHLCARIHSIFMLREDQAPGRSRSLAETARLEHGQTDARNLSRYVMELDQKADVLTKTKERIVGLYQQVDDHTRMELISIVNAIKTSSEDNRVWEDFKLCFAETDPYFLTSLSKKHPDLTTRDLKFCCYLKMNMTNDDIKSLLGINQESVRTHKYRLKKKMLLSKDTDLTLYLKGVGRQQSWVA